MILCGPAHSVMCDYYHELLPALALPMVYVSLLCFWYCCYVHLLLVVVLRISTVRSLQYLALEMYTRVA